MQVLATSTCNPQAPNYPNPNPHSPHTVQPTSAPNSPNPSLSISSCASLECRLRGALDVVYVLSDTLVIVLQLWNVSTWWGDEQVVLAGGFCFQFVDRIAGGTFNIAQPAWVYVWIYEVGLRALGFKL
jgi:hypothetical protein